MLFNELLLVESGFYVLISSGFEGGSVEFNLAEGAWSAKRPFTLPYLTRYICHTV